MRGYLSRRQTQLLLFGFFSSSIIFIAYPELDLKIAGLFFQDGFYLEDSLLVSALYRSVPFFVGFSLLFAFSFWMLNKYLLRKPDTFHGRHFLFLFLVLSIGAGFIVNMTFKKSFGRPRPRDIVEFNGTRHFIPAFYTSRQEGKNFSFSSGHGAAAFFSLALAALLKRRKAAMAAATIYGSSVSVARMAAGGHFFSDNLVSFFIMAITTDGLYYLFFLKERQQTHHVRQYFEIWEILTFYPRCFSALYWRVTASEEIGIDT